MTSHKRLRNLRTIIFGVTFIGLVVIPFAVIYGLIGKAWMLLGNAIFVLGLALIALGAISFAVVRVRSLLDKTRTMGRPL